MTPIAIKLKSIFEISSEEEGRLMAQARHRGQEIGYIALTLVRSGLGLGTYAMQVC